MSKRKLLQLVQENYVNGWDDPRMSTLSGFRRKGYTPHSIRTFCEKIGVAKRDNLIDISLLDFCLREELNKSASRVMVVLDPVKLIITNFDEDKVEELEGENLPDDPDNVRMIPFRKELWIEKEDFMEVPAKKWFRLAPGAMVRLKHAYIIRCDSFINDDSGAIKEIHCTYFPESKSGHDTSGLHVKGTIHWVSVKDAGSAEIRLYEQLFQEQDPANAEGDFKDHINTNSLQVIENAFIEPFLKHANSGKHFQFIRKGYFCLDKDSTNDKLVFNRTVTLKDAWAKEIKK